MFTSQMFANGIEPGCVSSGALARHREVIALFQFEALKFQVSFVEAELFAGQGDYASASTALMAGLEQVDRSFIAAELYQNWVPIIYAKLAEFQILAGELQDAQQSVEAGFRLDPSLPHLWAAKARLQSAGGSTQLALASVNYALAIWQGADPEYDELVDAKALAEELTRSIN